MMLCLFLCKPWFVWGMDAGVSQTNSSCNTPYHCHLLRSVLLALQFGKSRAFRLHSSHQRLSSPAALGFGTTHSRWGTGEAVVSRWVGEQRRRSKRKQWPRNISPCNDPTWLVKRPCIPFLRLISLMEIWDSWSPELFDYELNVPSIVNN